MTHTPRHPFIRATLSSREPAPPSSTEPTIAPPRESPEQPAECGAHDDPAAPDDQ